MHYLSMVIISFVIERETNMTLRPKVCIVRRTPALFSVKHTFCPQYATIEVEVCGVRIETECYENKGRGLLL